MRLSRVRAVALLVLVETGCAAAFCSLDLLVGASRTCGFGLAQVRESGRRCSRGQRPRTAMMAAKKHKGKGVGGLQAKTRAQDLAGWTEGGRGFGSGAKHAPNADVVPLDYSAMSAEALLDMLDDFECSDGAKSDEILIALRDKGYTIEVVDTSASGEVAYGDGEEEELLLRSEHEESLMRASPAYHSVHEDASKALQCDGLAYFPGALAPETAGNLRAFILEKRDEVEAALVQPAAEHHEEDYMSEVLAPRASPEGKRKRWDLKVPMCEEAAAALRQLLARDAPAAVALSSVLGDARTSGLHEMGAIISIPGAPRQVIHSDTVWTPQPVLYTAFVALQDVSPDMGPTTLLPGTHCEAAHERFDDAGAGGKDALLAASARLQGPLRGGDAVVYDSRVLHCGGANRFGGALGGGASTKAGPAAGERVVFYVSFACPCGVQDADNVATIVEDLKGKYTMSSLQEALQQGQGLS